MGVNSEITSISSKPLLESRKQYQDDGIDRSCVVGEDSSPLMSPKQAVSRRRPYHRCDDVEAIIVPSDQAYLDSSLHQGRRSSAGSLQPIDWGELTKVNTSSTKLVSRQTRQVCYAVTHTVEYNGEPIWRMQAESKYGIHGSSGYSACCTLMKSRGIVRVKILHKGKTFLGEGRNSTEIRNYDLKTLITESGEARRKELC